MVHGVLFSTSSYCSRKSLDSRCVGCLLHGWVTLLMMNSVPVMFQEGLAPGEILAQLDGQVNPAFPDQ